jgi:hypothetical protein
MLYPCMNYFLYNDLILIIHLIFYSIFFYKNFLFDIDKFTFTVFTCLIICIFCLDKKTSICSYILAIPFRGLTKYFLKVRVLVWKIN